MQTAICLALTGVLVVVGLVLTLLSLRRDDSFLGLAGMTAMVVGAIPATAYAMIDSA
jgi:hypothetical protein